MTDDEMQTPLDDSGNAVQDNPPGSATETPSAYSTPNLNDPPDDGESEVQENFVSKTEYEKARRVSVEKDRLARERYKIIKEQQEELARLKSSIPAEDIISKIVDEKVQEATYELKAKAMEGELKTVEQNFYAKFGIVPGTPNYQELKEAISAARITDPIVLENTLKLKYFDMTNNPEDNGGQVVPMPMSVAPSSVSSFSDANSQPKKWEETRKAAQAAGIPDVPDEEEFDRLWEKNLEEQRKVSGF